MWDRVLSLQGHHGIQTLIQKDPYYRDLAMFIRSRLTILNKCLLRIILGMTVDWQILHLMSSPWSIPYWQAPAWTWWWMGGSTLGCTWLVPCWPNPVCRTQGVCIREETQAVSPHSNTCQERREDNSQSLDEFSSHWNNRKDSCKRILVSEVWGDVFLAESFGPR